MIRTYLELKIKPGAAKAFADVFKDEEVLDNSVAQPGCHSAELTISADGLRAIVTAVWDDVAAYERWTSRSDRTTILDCLRPYLGEELEPNLVSPPFDVAVSGSSITLSSNDEEAL